MVSSSFVGYATMICTPRDLNYTTFRKKKQSSRNPQRVCRGGMFPRVFGDEFGDTFGDKVSELLNLVIILVMNLVNCQIR